MLVSLKKLLALLLSRLNWWQRIIVGLCVGGISTLIFILTFGAAAPLEPTKELLIDKRTKDALQHGLDAGAVKFKIGPIDLITKDLPAAAFTSCNNNIEAGCTFTFGRPLSDSYFVKNSGSATAIAMHEVGHALAYKLGATTEWLVYSAYLAIIVLACIGMSYTPAGMLVIGFSFTIVQILLSKFSTSDLETFQLAILLLSFTAISGGGIMLANSEWRRCPSYSGFVANPYLALIAVLSFVLISHQNDKLEAYSDLVSACQLQSVEPLSKGLSRLAELDGPSVGRISWLADPFHPTIGARIAALRKLERRSGLAEQCRLVWEGASPFVAGSY